MNPDERAQLCATPTGRPTHFGAECHHGHLARQCELCDRDDEIRESLQRLTEIINRIEVLVEQGVISAGRAREIHGLSPDEQRAVWRERAKLGELCSICRRRHGKEVQHACE